MTKKILLIAMGLLILEAHGSNTEKEHNSLGVIKSLQSLIQVQKNSFQTSSSNQNVKEFEYIDKNRIITDISLAPFFLKDLLFKTSDNYFPLINRAKECSFYSLLLNGLIKPKTFGTSTYYALVTFDDSTTQTFKISHQNFFETLFKIKCANLKELNDLFKSNQLRSTIDALGLKAPKGERECKITHREWISNSYTPYICKVNDTIVQGAAAEKIIKKNPTLGGRKRKILNEKTRKKASVEKSLSYFQASFIKNLCSNLKDVDKFCFPYIQEDIWGKVINGERPQYLMEHKCKNMFGKKNIGIKELRKCATRFNNDPKVCNTRGTKGYPSFFPMPNCSETSAALNNGSLKTTYHDCPGLIDNEAITNIHRISNHFVPRDIKSTPDTCAGESVYSFAKLNFDFDGKENWPMKICYLDKIQDKEVCTSYIPGDIDDESISETKIVTDIVKRMYDVPRSTKCEVVSSATFKPQRLRFQTGCFIVFDESRCTTIKCDKKVYLDLKVLKDIRFEGVPLFTYFPNSYLKKKQSLNNILVESYKLKVINVRNITDLRNFFKQHKGGLIHGIGCYEDIVPGFFEQRSFNQCTPTPFVIDGVTQKANKPFAVTRLSTDDIHSPRLIFWNRIFSAVLSYKELHPLKTWTLYGVKK